MCLFATFLKFDGFGEFLNFWTFYWIFGIVGILKTVDMFRISEMFAILTCWKVWWCDDAKEEYLLRNVLYCLCQSHSRHHRVWFVLLSKWLFDAIEAIEGIG